jgi:hypothetical protein
MAEQTKTQRLVASAMREVHTNEPSTVARADVSEARKEKMRVAIALDIARAAGARIRRRPQGSGVFTDAEIAQGYRQL